MTVVAAVPSADRKSNDGRCDEDEVHDYEDGLKFPHNLAHDRSEDSVADDTSKKDAVDVSVRRRPIAIAGDNNDRKKHQRETI